MHAQIYMNIITPDVHGSDFSYERYNHSKIKNIRHINDKNPLYLKIPHGSDNKLRSTKEQSDTHSVPDKPPGIRGRQQ